MSVVNGFKANVPFCDVRTGVLTYEGLRFLQQIFVRIGGTEGQTNQELVQDQYADAGIEELKHEAGKAIDALNQLPPIEPSLPHSDQAPPGAFFAPPPEDPSARIEALEAMVAKLQADIAALLQGYQL